MPKSRNKYKYSKKQKYTKKQKVRKTKRTMKHRRKTIKQRKTKMKGGKRNLTREEKKKLDELKQNIKKTYKRGIKNHILSMEYDGAEGCYSKTGYPVCYIHEDKETCENNTDDIREFCVWKEPDHKQNKKKFKGIRKFMKKIHNKLENSYKEIDSPVGKVFQVAALTPAVAPIPGTDVFLPLSLATSEIIQGVEGQYYGKEGYAAKKLKQLNKKVD